jgi:hypothetical protein
MSTNKSFEKALTGVRNLCKDENDNLILAVIERIPKHTQMAGMYVHTCICLYVYVYICMYIFVRIYEFTC